MNKIIVNGHTLHYELGRTCEDLENFDGLLWDFSVDDILTGAIEPDEDMVYWYINERFYETDLRRKDNE